MYTDFKEGLLWTCRYAYIRFNSSTWPGQITNKWKFLGGIVNPIAYFDLGTTKCAIRAVLHVHKSPKSLFRSCTSINCGFHYPALACNIVKWHVYVYGCGHGYLHGEKNNTYVYTILVKKKTELLILKPFY